MAQTASETNDVSFDDYPFDKGDEVFVDWTEGMGSRDMIRGEIEDICMGGGGIVVSVVDYSQDDWPDGRTYDCAPEWIYTRAIDE